MKYKAVSDFLKKTRDPNEVADFFLAPAHRPDLVLEVLMEKQRRKARQPNSSRKEDKSPALAKTASSRLRPHGSGMRARLLSNPARPGFRLLAAFLVVLFLSCASAPNHGGGADRLMIPVLMPDEQNISDLQYRLETAGNALENMIRLGSSLLFGESPGSDLLDSFLGRLLGGSWAGLALIKPEGGIIALARSPHLDQVSRWMETYKELEKENRVLRRTLQAIQETRDSEKIYLEIDLAANRLLVKMGTQTLYKFPIVSGRGYTPRSSKRKRRFATPRGIFTIIKKERNPVWRPPAWHFRERGEEPPRVTPRIRGVLGKYRLNLGHGYGIHGTASGRIGRPGKYSHGCIRMNRKDLAIVYKLTDVGTKVFIY